MNNNTGSITKEQEERRDLKKVLRILIPVVALCASFIFYIFYSHTVVYTVMIGRLVNTNPGFVEATRASMTVDGFLSVPQGSFLEIKGLRNNNKRLCTLPFKPESRQSCITIKNLVHVNY